MIDNLAIAIGSAFVTLIGTRWVDTRRQLAGERSTLASELRVQLAEAHRRSEACVRAMKAAKRVAAWDARGVPTDGFRNATTEFEKTLDSLRSQASELFVRTPAARSNVSMGVTSMLNAGEELLRWMRYREIPADWNGDEENFVLATTDQLTIQPELLIMVGAPQAAPAAVDPETAAVLRRVARQERRKVRLATLSRFVGRFTGKTRREWRAMRVRQDAARAGVEDHVDDPDRHVVLPPREAAGIAEDADGPYNMKHEETTFYDACILSARMETNVPQGGDAGHGGRTRLTLTDEGSFAFGERPRGMVSDDRAKIEVLGDIEARVLAEALTWAGEKLDTMIATKGN
jgi:hypothetical protein